MKLRALRPQRGPTRSSSTSAKLHKSERLLPESPGQNLALTVLHVPYSLKSGTGKGIQSSPRARDHRPSSEYGIDTPANGTHKPVNGKNKPVIGTNKPVNGTNNPIKNGRAPGRSCSCPRARATTAHSTFPVPAHIERRGHKVRREHLVRFQVLEPESQGQNLALTGLYVPRSGLDWLIHARMTSQPGSRGFE